MCPQVRTGMMGRWRSVSVSTVVKVVEEEEEVPGYNEAFVKHTSHIISSTFLTAVITQHNVTPRRLRETPKEDRCCGRSASSGSLRAGVTKLFESFKVEP